MDFGVAVHPQDGDQKGQLMGLADERLYQLKHSGREASRVVPPEPRPPDEPRPAAAPVTGSAVPAEPRATPPRVQPPAEQRKWERVSLAGTKAHAVLTDAGQKMAKVIDLSYGGVALHFEKSEDFPSQFNAVLHVPILPPVRVVLRTVQTQVIEGGGMRLGCSFVS